MNDEQPPEPKPQTPRERLDAMKAKSRVRKVTPRNPSPTRTIEPGKMHYAVAEGVLRSVHDKLGLDVGTIPDIALANPDGDEERLAHLVAHAVARGFDRIGPLRRLSRHLEGADKRAGIMSDLLSAALELYSRNPDALRQLGKQYAQNVAERRTMAAQQSAAPNGAAPPQPAPVGVR